MIFYNVIFHIVIYGYAIGILRIPISREREPSSLEKIRLHLESQEDQRMKKREDKVYCRWNGMGNLQKQSYG